MHLADVELRGNGRGGILMVTREQHGLDLKRGELVDHAGTFLTDRVGQGEEAREHAVHGGVGDGAALRGLDNSGLSGLFGNGDVVLGKELRVAREEGFTVNASGDAAPRRHLEVFGLAQRLARLLLTAAGDGLAERVLRIALRRGAEAVELVIGEGGSALCTRTTFGVPQVSVPVLSKAIFFTAARRSSASPSRTRESRASSRCRWRP